MKKLIIIDTLKTVLERERTFMLRSDIHILTASSSHEVINMHRSEHVDLIILDLDLPDEDGATLCSRIRNDSELRDVSIMIACPAEEEAIDRCVYSGANALVTKPVYQQELINKAGELLDIPQRENLRVLMNISVEGRHNDSFFCTSKDISTSGMLLETNKALKKGDIISFSFFLRLNRITIDGKISRITHLGSNNYQYGLQFINLDQRSRDLIDEYIKIRQVI